MCCLEDLSPKTFWDQHPWPSQGRIAHDLTVYAGEADDLKAKGCCLLISDAWLFHHQIQEIDIRERVGNPVDDGGLLFIIKLPCQRIRHHVLEPRNVSNVRDELADHGQLVTLPV